MLKTKGRQNKKNNDDEIINFYEHIPKKYLNNVDNPNYDLHNIDLPFRILVVAPSGAGKTNCLLNLLKKFSTGVGTFSDITIVTANKDEPLYNYLEGEYDGIRVLEGLHSLPKLDDFDKHENHLVVIDDMITEKKLDTVEKYFIRARKLNVSVIFLTQSYYDTPKMIRKNCSYLLVLDLGGSNREVKAIMSEWSGELDKKVLFKMYHDAVSEPLTPFIIKGGKCDPNKKYRKAFTGYYNVADYIAEVEREELDNIMKQRILEQKAKTRIIKKKKNLTKSTEDDMSISDESI